MASCGMRREGTAWCRSWQPQPLSLAARQAGLEELLLLVEVGHRPLGQLAANGFNPNGHTLVQRRQFNRKSM